MLCGPLRCHPSDLGAALGREVAHSGGRTGPALRLHRLRQTPPPARLLAWPWTCPEHGFQRGDSDEGQLRASLASSGAITGLYSTEFPRAFMLAGPPRLAVGPPATARDWPSRLGASCWLSSWLLASVVASYWLVHQTVMVD